MSEASGQTIAKRSSAAGSLPLAVQPIGFLDDLKVGDELVLGTFSLTEEDILRFAKEFDPLPFHVDPQAARQSVFGGIIASGLHTLSCIHALSIRCGFLTGDTIIVGAGIDELRFRRPVRADDALTVTAKILSIVPSPKHKGRGTARISYGATNQNGEVALSFIDNHVIRSRPA